MLEVGCGTGNDAIWIASQGADVIAVDLSESAIAEARKKADAAGVSVDFRAGSFPDGIAPVDWAYDRGCFHSNRSEEERAEFVASLAERVRPGGLWLSLIGSTEGPPRDHGPPRLSARYR